MSETLFFATGEPDSQEVYNSKYYTEIDIGIVGFTESQLDLDATIHKLEYERGEEEITNNYN